MEVNKREIEEAFDKHADTFTDRFGDVSAYSRFLDRFAAELPEVCHIYDIACGPGNMSAYIKDKVKEASFTCVDISQNMLDICSGNLSKCKTIKSDIADFEMEDSAADGVICSFGIPFLNKEQVSVFISNVAKGLKNDGVMYLSCMQGDTYGYEKTCFSGDDEIFFVYHSKGFLDEVFAKNKLTILSYNEQDYHEEDGVLIDMIYLVKKAV